MWLFIRDYKELVRLLVAPTKKHKRNVLLNYSTNMFLIQLPTKNMFFTYYCNTLHSLSHANPFLSICFHLECRINIFMCQSLQQAPSPPLSQSFRTLRDDYNEAGAWGSIIQEHDTRRGSSANLSRVFGERVNQRGFGSGGMLKHRLRLKSKWVFNFFFF